MEKVIFLDKFMQFPKNFSKIASFLTNRSTKDCVRFYYDSKAGKNMTKLELQIVCTWSNLLVTLSFLFSCTYLSILFVFFINIKDHVYLFSRVLHSPSLKTLFFFHLKFNYLSHIPPSHVTFSPDLFYAKQPSLNLFFFIPSSPPLYLSLSSYLLSFYSLFSSYLFHFIHHAAIPYKALLRESDNRKRHLRTSWVHAINAAHSGEICHVELLLLNSLSTILFYFFECCFLLV